MTEESNKYAHMVSILLQQPKLHGFTILWCLEVICIILHSRLDFIWVQ